jgi:NAD-dependent deacetylase sirtuin 2
MITAPKDLCGIARFITSPECKSVIVLSGAGVSVSSGIPDFRSPGGMYDTLRPDLITAEPYQREMMKSDPTYVVEKQMFLSNAFPYLEVRRPFILGTREQKWKATIAHRFTELLHTKTSKLTRIYTQNIDGLDYQCTSIPKEKIINVHGTISEVSCEVCGTDMDTDEFCNSVQSSIKDIYGSDDQAPNESSPILCKNCGKAAVKPKTVLFGSSLPSEFFTCIKEDLPSADLLIVAGTSLVVSPANSLVYSVEDTCLRMVVNKDEVGQDLGIEYGESAANGRDFFAQGSCDEVFLDLIKELGWMDDLKQVSHLLPQASADLL